tara:strand:- start:4989 stop:5195 length:207 start_codon:yes stop_codon:yes gene_type:complete
MCFGPSSSAKQASAEQRVEADDVEREELVDRAEQKREDISDVLKKKKGGGTRRSLFSNNRQGFLGRFD